MVAKKKERGDLVLFYRRAREAAKRGLTAKEFAKQEGTLANNISARLYECVLEGMEPVRFKEAEAGGRRRRQAPDNISQITLFKGRAKVPYLTLKVPAHIVSQIGKEGDRIEWSLSRGRIVGKKVEAAEESAE